MAAPNNTLRLVANDGADHEDHTEHLKEWVKTHKNILDVFLDAYCVVNTKSQVIDFNVAFIELVGETYRKILKIGLFHELLKTELGPIQCPAMQVLSTQKPVRVDELRALSKSFPHLNLIVSGIPLFVRDKLMGALLTIRNVTAEHDLQRKYLQRKSESVTDNLTQLYNKAFTEDTVLRQVRISLRDLSTFSIIMADIDFFKKINDTYGHPGGDQVLTSVGQIIRSEIRGSDLAGRVGGEEFLILLSNTNPKGAKIFAERLRKRIETAEVIFEGQKIPLSASLGTATFTETWRPGLNPETSAKELLKRADEALYHSKKHGRNQVTQAENLVK